MDVECVCAQLPCWTCVQRSAPQARLSEQAAALHTWIATVAALHCHPGVFEKKMIPWHSSCVSGACMM